MIMHSEFQDMKEKIRRADRVVRDYPPGSQGAEELARARDAFSDAMLAAIAGDEPRAHAKLAQAAAHMDRATGPGAAGPAPSSPEARADQGRELLMARALLMALGEEGFDEPPGDWPRLTQVAVQYTGKPVPRIRPAEFERIRTMTVGQFAGILTRDKAVGYRSV